MPSFLDLPAELIPLVLRHVHRPGLKCLRQTCRLMRQAATPELFHTVSLFPDDQSADRMESLLADPRLHKLPRKIYIHTIETDLDPDDAYRQGKAEWPERWNSILPRVKEFSNLQSAVLRFDQNYGTESEYRLSSYPHSPAFRFRALDEFFSMVASLKLPLKELGIRNLQVDNSRNGKTQEILANVLRSLKALRLTVVSEYTEAAPENDIESRIISTSSFPKPGWPQQYTCYNTSVSSAAITSASTPSSTSVGVYFPRLNSLSLGNYTFSEDSQIDWIVSHAATLQELYLDDCVILYDVAIFESNLSRCAISKDETEFRRDGSLYYKPRHYRCWDRRWHHLFTTFAQKLPNLRRFAMGSSDWDNGVPFEKEGEIHVGLFLDRYMACYDGYGPSCYMVGEVPQQNERVRPECDGEDREALRLLLRRLGQTVEENNTMPHGREVKDLIFSQMW